jgi:hypothetical protein
MTQRTIQLRRYRIAGPDLPAYVEWFRSELTPLRHQFGFSVEFAFALPTTGEFVWAASYPGGRQQYETADAAYFGSDARKVMISHLPCDVDIQSVEFVQSVA